jgi:hypothetical protein
MLREKENFPKKVNKYLPSIEELLRTEFNSMLIKIEKVHSTLFLGKVE